MRNVVTGLFLASALFSAGCSTGPDYQRPTVARPDHFIGERAVLARNAEAKADLVTWWRSFDDPLLVELVEQSLRDNLDIAQAAARVTQARAGLRTANAALLPSGQITANGSYTSQSLETPTGRALSGAPGFQRQVEQYDASLGASWELDVFGGLRRGQQAARAGYLASKADVYGAQVAVAAQTAETYMAIRSLQSRIAIVNDQIETQRRLVDIIGLQFRKGVAAELQLRQAEGAYAQVAASLPELQVGLESALNALDVLTGTPPGTHRTQFEPPRPIPAAPSVANFGGPVDLLRRRPDLIAAEQRLVATNARIGQAMSEYYPKFSLSGLLGTATMATGDLFGAGATQAQGALGLRWRLFDFARVDAEITAARGRDAEALAAYRLAVLRASEEVENALSALVQREAQERILERGETSLVRARDAAFAAYKGGAVSLIEVLDADNRLLATRDARAQAQTEAARAAIASFRAVGGGWAAPLPRE
ncbi:NodT family efflux transporter outer membrane factor (OMF) lipoprotein [Sphingomonas sp. BE270]|jgi:NodT family efflux transporter outer membrane factor (OMF) lipoprotein|uniref:efflux transporter outer membrane subunit n=1 Tax=Sphingomonas sp. BE270 TaxID=2817726 RepID=UPI00285EDD16|nr:efflux transporter outer membrane subunit [Sphingomonas sp. BE270]MDR7259932.1 NodT family efflux transporter outer membrane factor (OMF) lipoprotein [Sphingomonas sp. BE270]